MGSLTSVYKRTVGHIFTNIIVVNIISFWHVLGLQNVDYLPNVTLWWVVIVPCLITMSIVHTESSRNTT